jgi:peptide deformylase
MKYSMALRQIIKEGDETLRKRSREIARFDERLQELIDDMFQTMYANNGVGLAAPQVGILKRLFVMDVKDDNGPRVMINPRIVAAEGSQINSEGCLSIPGQWGEVERPVHVTAEALDRQGQPFSISVEGFAAICVCHEIDHLDGILFRDKARGELYTA